MCNAIVWDDSRTKNTVAHYQHMLETVGIQTEPGVWRKGRDGTQALKDM